MPLAINLIDDARDWAETRIRSGAFASLSDYPAELVRRDRDVDLDAALQVGEDSGTSDLSFEEVIANARREFDAANR